MTPTIPIQRLPHGEGLPLPAYETPQAAGMDLRAAVPEHEPFVLKPGSRHAVPTGLAFALPNGFFPDESNLLAAYLAAKGFRRVGVFHEEGIIGDEFWGVTRGPPHAAFARQVGMYLAHVVFGLSLTEVGQLFEKGQVAGVRRR